MKKSIVVLFGGASSEHNVSCVSASTVLSRLDRDKYDVSTIGITKNGGWFYTEASECEIKSCSWENSKSNRRALVSTDRDKRGIFVFESESSFRIINADCIIPVLHGKNGEDGTVQGLCQLAGIPYVGCGVLSSAASMDKSFTKIIVAAIGIKQADYVAVKRNDYVKGPNKVLSDIQTHFGNKFPLFVKPCSAGSSVGVSKVCDAEQLKNGIEVAYKHDGKLLVEEAIRGREVEVAVLGNNEPKASVVGEVVACEKFYDYDTKYNDSVSHTVIPADISEKASETLRENAVRIFKALDCTGLSRVDFFLDEGNNPVFNEINSLPGFTGISMYPALWEASGLGLTDLLDEIVELAMDNYETWI